MEKTDLVKVVTKTGSFFEEFDPRMKLLIVVVMSLSIFLAGNDTVLLVNYGIVVMLFLTSGFYLIGLKVFSFVAMCFLLSLWQPAGIQHELSFAFEFLGVFLPRVMIFFIMGTWMSSKMRMSDFVSALEKMHIHKGIVIMIAVVFRYFPTVKDEIYYIHSTMKLRGINVSIKNILTHPIRTVEYAIIPLILRFFTVADELSVASMTRGLDIDNKRVPYREIKLRYSDIFVTVLILGIVMGTRLLTGTMFKA